MTFRPAYEDPEKKIKMLEEKVHELKKELAEALQSEEDSRLLVESSSDFISTHDLSGNFSYANTTFEKSLGYSTRELATMNSLEIVHPDDLEMMQQKMAQVFGGKSLKDVECRSRRKDGAYIDIQISLTPVFENNNHVIGLSAIGRDITDRIRAEEALKESESKFSKAFQSNTSMMALSTFEEGRLLNVNDEFLSVLGYTQGEVIGKTASQLGFYADSRQREVIKKVVIKKGCARNIEVTFRTKNGRLRYGLFSAEPINVEDRKCWLTVFHDITERKKAEKALKKSEEKFKILFEKGNDALAYLGKDGLIIDVNENISKIFGYNREEVIGKNILGLDIMLPYDKQRVAGESDALLADSLYLTGVYSALRKDGEMISIKSDVKIINEGKHKNILFVLKDITQQMKIEDEKKRLEAQLRRAQKMEALGTMAGGIAHDFNNILSSIILNAEMAFDDAPKHSDMEKSVNEILNGGQRARELVAHILTFSRDVEVERKPVRIHTVVKETLKMLKSILPSTIHIHQDVVDHVGTILADTTQIQQLVMNLCNNAAHAMREKGGQLEVILKDVTIDEELQDPERPPGNYVKIIVRDTGHGIAPENRDKIFDPFFTTKKPGEGTGLGLSVVHGIVTGNDGIITMDSKNGLGTTFEVLFPVKETPLIVESEQDTRLATGNEKILFVDDEEAIVEVGRKIIERLGYEVTARTSVTEALELFRECPEAYDLVITDMTMPYMTGLDLSKELMNIRPDIPIIICTGYSYLITPKKAETIGIRDYVMKPFRRKEMAQTIRNVLDTRAVERRADKRFRVVETAMATIKSKRPGQCQIVDIGMGGLSFYHEEDDDLSMMFAQLAISMAGESFYLNRVPCQMVSNKAIDDNPHNGKTKRCGVSFGKLTQNQSAQIEHFIESYTNADIRAQQ